MKLVRRTMVVGILSLTAACAGLGVKTAAFRLSPEQAVMNAAEVPNGVSGVFGLIVRATGRQDGLLYLNSQPDYRDQRTLTVVISPVVERALQGRFGEPVEKALLHHDISVRGTARKTRIDFTSDGRPSGKYYFQTHLVLRSDHDLTVEGELFNP